MVAQQTSLKAQLVTCVQSYFSKGLLSKAYGTAELLQEMKQGGTKNGDTSIYFSTAVQVATELFCGLSAKPWFTFDGVAASLHESIVNNLRAQLLKIDSPVQLADYFSKLAAPISYPTKVLYQEYLRRFAFVRANPTKMNRDTLHWVQQALSIYKWIDHYMLDKAILIDLGTSSLQFVSNQQVSYTLKAIVGKPTTPTPFFAAWATQLVLYPYWFVPNSIAAEEMLPKIKKDKAWLSRQNMQVFDKLGRALNSDTINWRKFTAHYFPYTLRQSTGCDNALGLLKIELSSPYGVYIHDTNNKAAFLATKRFLSHGCIRVEEPFQLGNSLLSEKLDTTFLQSCLLAQKPVYKRFSTPIPVFSFYSLAHPNATGQIVFTPDRYSLFK